jgi:hypothetical protein
LENQALAYIESACAAAGRRLGASVSTTEKRGVEMNGYARFGAMIATSTIVMFGLMYFNTYQFDHVFFSETRAYMALVMGATMAVVMLGFMLGMYKNRRVNMGILGGSVVVFAVALWLVRSQTTVDDVSYMRAMIPHHSIAILTSERARISDPRVRKLADGIIDAQRREIDEMKALIRDLANQR